MSNSRQCFFFFLIEYSADFVQVSHTGNDQKISSFRAVRSLHRRRNDYQNDIRWPVEIPSRNHGVNGRRYSARVPDEKFVKRISYFLDDPTLSLSLASLLVQENNPCPIKEARRNVLFDKSTRGFFFLPSSLMEPRHGEYNFDSLTTTLFLLVKFFE